MNLNKYFHIALAFFLAAFAGVAQYLSLFRSFDLSLYDAAHKFSRFEAAEDILIVDIDEHSLENFGAWPWSRRYHAGLLTQLKALGVEHVAFDVIFSELDLNDIEGDTLFAEAIGSHRNVVLPIFIGQLQWQGYPIEVPPASLFYAAKPKLGHVHIDCNADAICRSLYLKEGVGQPYWPHLSLALLQQQRHQKNLPGVVSEIQSDYSSKLIYRDFHNFIEFPRGDHNFNTISYFDVLNGYFTTGKFKGFTAFVGSTAAGLGDEISTPAGSLPGVVVNATVYQQLRSDTLIQEVRPVVVALVTSVLGFACLFVLSRLAPINFLIATSFCLIATFFIMVFLLFGLRVWFPISSLLLLLIVYYPLWNWFKLQLALNFLKVQLNKLKLEGLIGSDLIAGELAIERLQRASVPPSIEVVTNTLRRLEAVNSLVEEHRFIIENTLARLQEAVVLCSDDSRIILANDAAKKQFNLNSKPTLSDISGQLKLVQHRQYRVWEEFVDAVQSGKSVSGAELVMTTDDGEGYQTVLYCRGGQTNFERAGNAPANLLILTFTDITSSKNIERSRLDTLSFLSHDLRSPMVSILALISNIQSGRNTDGPDANLEKIKAYAENNLSYSESILQLSRAEGLDSEGFSPIDMHSIVDAAYSGVSDYAKSKNIRIHVDREDRDFWVNGNAELLERAVQNLLTNAIKYSESRTEVSISLTGDNDFIVISVEDNGMGIDSADIDVMFDRYKRGKSRHSSDGAGLGLYFVKTVIQKHDGKIEVESKLGHGTCMSLYFPYLGLEE